MWNVPKLGIRKKFNPSKLMYKLSFYNSSWHSCNRQNIHGRNLKFSIMITSGKGKKLDWGGADRAFKLCFS